MPIGMRFIIYYACFRLNIPVINEIANTKITAPSTDGTIAIPAICLALSQQVLLDICKKAH